MGTLSPSGNRLGSKRVSKIILMQDYEHFDLGDIKLLSGKILKPAKLAYKTYGTLNKNSDNVIVLPTFYTGSHIRNEGFIGKNRAINPNKYFIVSINMFGNGLSSSPSNSAKPQNGARFPKITLWDNVYCQHKLLTEKLKIRKINLNLIGKNVFSFFIYFF